MTLAEYTSLKPAQRLAYEAQMWQHRLSLLQSESRTICGAECGSEKNPCTLASCPVRYGQSYLGDEYEYALRQYIKAQGRVALAQRGCAI